MLRSFELVSRLKIDFWKSFLMGVNVSTPFLEMATASFTVRLMPSLLSTYLVYQWVRASRRLATWQSLIDSLRRRLNRWGNRYVSSEGRIVLINSILNNIPIFYMSFLKILVKVWKVVVRVQRHFLRGGIGSGKRIPWVKWSEVYKPKKNGGLWWMTFACSMLAFLASGGGDYYWESIHYLSL